MQVNIEQVNLELDVVKKESKTGEMNSKMQRKLHKINQEIL